MSKKVSQDLDSIYDTAFEAGYGKGFNDGYSDGVHDFTIVMEDVIYNQALDSIREHIASSEYSSLQELISSLDSLQRVTHLDSGSYITD